MPQLPTFLADFMEPRFARKALVQEVWDLAPGLRKVAFQGAALHGVSYRPGQEIEFRVSRRAFRHYTPSFFSPEDGYLEVLFHLHGLGPGSTWAQTLSAGQPVNILGPGGRFGLRDADNHVFLGDETTLGLFSCLESSALRLCDGAIEVGPGALSWPDLAGLSIDSVERNGQRGAALVDWLEGVNIRVKRRTAFYLAGHAQTIASLRRWLTHHGWARRQIHCKTYWADGKCGL